MVTLLASVFVVILIWDHPWIALAIFMWLMLKGC